MSLILSTAPHIRSPRSTRRLMGNVVISLLPALACGINYFGMNAALVAAVSVATAVAAEWVWGLISRRQSPVNDLSAVVTGLLLALCVTPATPWWAVMVGAAFAIIVVKQLFGGIGDNFLNPALAARAVMLASWPAYMTTHYLASGFGTDAVTSATPLITGGVTPVDLLLGSVPGAIGETCKLAIIAGFLFLLVTRTISCHIPLITVGSAFILSWALGLDPVVSILSGGLLFGAVFMATDYVTSPMNKLSQGLYAVGIGVITVLIRVFGAYPEGVTYAILLMNILTPLLDRMMPQRIYGCARAKEAKKG